MTDTQPPSSLPENSQVPTGPPRIPGLNVEAAQKVLDELDDELGRYEGSIAYQYVAAYESRAHMRFALGYPCDTVLDDFWMAGRTLSEDPSLHLGRFASEQFRTRRIRPVEYGILGGQLDLARRLASSYAFPMTSARADMGGMALQTEARIVSPGLVGEQIREPQHVAGFAAAAYSTALSAAVRGFADEVKLSLALLADITFAGELSPALKAVMFRYTGLCECLLELAQPVGRNIPGILADQIQRYTAQLSERMGPAFLAPKQPNRYLDTSSLAVMAVAILAGYPLDEMPPDPNFTPFAVGYGDFAGAMGENREIPVVPGELSPEELMAAAQAAAGITPPKQE